MLDLSVALVAFVATAYVLQDRLIFGKPRRIRSLDPRPHDVAYRVEELRLHRPDGVVLEGFRSYTHTTPGCSSRVLLYFGGRGEDIAWVACMSRYLESWEVYAFNYRSFGKSGGSPSEASAKRDAAAIYEYIRNRAAPSSTTLAVAGRGLGSAIALWLARSRRVDRLILVSPFPSLRTVLEATPLLRALKHLLRCDMDSIRHAAYVTCPALVLMGTNDRRIPNDLSLRLAESLGSEPTVVRCVGETHATIARSLTAQRAMTDFLAAGRRCRACKGR